MRQDVAIKNIKRNATIMLTGNMVASIISLLSLSIFTYSQGPELFGYYVLALTFVEIASKVFVIDTWQAVIKFLPDFEQENNRDSLLIFLKFSFLLEFISLLLAATLLFLFSGLLLYFFNVPTDYRHDLNLLMTVILFQGLEISTGIFRVFNKFAVQVKILIFSAALKLLVFLLLYLLKADLSWFIYGTVFAHAMAFILRLRLLTSLMKEKDVGLSKVLSYKFRYEGLQPYKVIQFIMYNNLSIGVRMVSRQLDVVLVGKLLGAEAVGLYKIAKEVANMISKLMDPIYQSIYPELSRLLSQNRKDEARRIALKISFYTGLAGLIFYAGFFLVGEWAIGIAFGNDFKAAYPIALVYFIALFVALISLPVVPLMLSHGMAKQSFWNQLHATLIYCVVLYPMVINHAAIGAAVAYIIFYITWALLAWNSVRRIQ